MFIVVSILLILVKLGNLYVTAELCNNIDDYVLVYNHIKGIKKAGSGTMFILLSLNSKNLKQNKLRFVWLRGSASRPRSSRACLAPQPAVRLHQAGLTNCNACLPRSLHLLQFYNLNPCLAAEHATEPEGAGGSRREPEAAGGRGRSHCPPPCIFKIYRLSNDFHQFINFYSGNSIAII